MSLYCVYWNFRPCPAINTLANHGFIPRDGVVEVEALADALQQVYRVSRNTLRNGPIEGAIGLGLTEPCGSDTCLSIDQLGQNRYNRETEPPEAQEHDSSHFREDSTGDDIDLTASPELVDRFFEMQSGTGSLNIQDVMAYQRERIVEGCVFRSGDDTPREWTPGHRGGAAIQGALLFVLAQAGQGNPQKEQSNLRSIVEDERLPASYMPNPDFLFTFANPDVNAGSFQCHSDALRDAFRQNVDRTLCQESACEVAAGDIDCTAVLEVPSVPIVPLDPFGLYSPDGC